ncbi:UDP-N-acetylmuramoyl-tripeptide--D-alanyl-D-alanine ligase [Entomohabitans teleogrylli]|uniref:UDP-N-acetylmuramoyl-tripeptide--D-alanyl-D- alanine ligase n=1 Tax=Entomohabitans teleogrylli TaxID=1384589 RepID=UPI00073D2C28|nr:UDP-N-acetylmuramoyl-tripeptide--D-alanyl-D-alanine ligase [Entomohabitans teleogrylli]
MANYPQTTVGEAIWHAEELAGVTGGQWRQPPPAGWSATGLSIWAPAMQPGNIVVVRTQDDNSGIPPTSIPRLKSPPAAIIATAGRLEPIAGIPLLEVQSSEEAILALGRYARDRMTGNIIGITGSAGKTTCVAMLAAALAPWGPVCKSAHNANLPRGVAWNLASMPWNTPQIVLEMAIGRMKTSTLMARPQIAIFTNIQPAHLGERSTLNDIARAKSLIFVGMTPGSTAILNRDMQEWQTVHDAARQRQLNIVHYGASPECDIRLIDYDPGERQVTARIGDREIRYRCGADGRHMALNSLAVLATVLTLGYPLEPAIEQLARFSALSGRGEELELTLNGQQLTIIDDAYNANPGSMKAALEKLSDKRTHQRRIAVLGEMADLGPGALSYHTDLAELINHSAIDRVYLAGELYEQCWQSLADDRRGDFVATPGQLRAVLENQLQQGDVVLFKGSNSTRVYELVSWVKSHGGTG